MIYLIIVLWLASSVFTYGSMFAYFQREYKIIAEKEYYSNMTVSFFVSLLGPFGMLVWTSVQSVSCESVIKHGFKFK